jgi:hypothetical protein
MQNDLFIKVEGISSAIDKQPIIGSSAYSKEIVL